MDIREPHYTRITSQNRWFDLNLKEVWKYRDLIVLFTKRSFQVTYKQTILGPAWLFLSPFITSVIYTFVFGGIAGMSTDGIPQLLFYLCSSSIWTFFSTCVTKNATTFTANANVFGKVYFPRLTVPISNVISALVQFLIQMVLVAIFLSYYIATGAVHPNWVAFPLVLLCLLQLGIMGMGFGIVISSLTTKYRDLSILVTFGMQLWMYATPVVYPLSQLDGGVFKMLLLLNPVTTSIEMFRYAILGCGTIDPIGVIVSWLFTFAIAIFGILIFNRVEKNFMDTV